MCLSMLLERSSTQHLLGKFYDQTSDGIKFKLIRVGNHQPQLAIGAILEATNALDYGIFQNTLVLLTRYSPDEGATGFILNKVSSNF